MFWMMNNMGPHGRRMHHRGYRPMGGGLFLFPGIMVGGLVAVSLLIAGLQVAGAVIGAVFTGVGAVFSGLIHGLGAAFSGLSSALGSVFSGSLAAGLPVGIALGLIWYFRNKKNRSEENNEG